ncbi:hypothetical protein Hypma_012368 [Hypsizygus marmoreus]|uniref:DUF6534 domain-containing protein n=1 Tax=Hypsizygus marmoreus TaxID=39966 RepID=A0A369K9P0_HYPMA|nr:hypothetical protein Hypma_012368 [Hypsizygus marmoreus]
MASHVVDIPKTFGALLVGGLFASMLAGVGVVQVYIYFRLYPKDFPHLKFLVLFVWLLDTCQTTFIWAALWEYFIDGYGSELKIDYIPWSISMTILFTAILTFAVHCFYIHRIHILSHRNWWITLSIFILALARLGSALLTTAKTLHLHSYLSFKLDLWWLFTLGLALSSCVDVLITASLCFLLQSSRGGTTSLNHIIDSLIRYAFEAGFLTSAGTFVSMLCWLTMRHNLIFMGVYFAVSKFHTNSLLVILNTRQQYRSARSRVSSEFDFPTLQLDTRRKRNTEDMSASHSRRDESITDFHRNGKVMINVETSVHRHNSHEPQSSTE